MKFLILILLSLLITSCASISEKDCKHGDWKAVGQKDGKYGFNSNRIQKHGEACSEFGITPDKSLYTEGYNVGIKTYCTEQGTKLGTKGDVTTKSRNCDGRSEFLAARGEALKLFCYEQVEPHNV